MGQDSENRGVERNVANKEVVVRDHLQSFTTIIPIFRLSFVLPVVFSAFCLIVFVFVRSCVIARDFGLEG